MPQNGVNMAAAGHPRAAGRAFQDAKITKISTRSGGTQLAVPHARGDQHGFVSSPATRSPVARPAPEPGPGRLARSSRYVGDECDIRPPGAARGAIELRDRPEPDR